MTQTFGYLVNGTSGPVSIGYDGETFVLSVGQKSPIIIQELITSPDPLPLQIRFIPSTGTAPSPSPPGPAASPYVPVGGAAGQILAKNSSTDYDAGWETFTDANLNIVPETIVFNEDGSITTTVNGQVVVTSFSGSTILETYGAPISRTVTTTFNVDGSITRQ